MLRIRKNHIYNNWKKANMENLLSGNLDVSLYISGKLEPYNEESVLKGKPVCYVRGGDRNVFVAYCGKKYKVFEELDVIEENNKYYPGYKINADTYTRHSKIVNKNHPNYYLTQDGYFYQGFEGDITKTDDGKFQRFLLVAGQDMKKYCNSSNYYGYSMRKVDSTYDPDVDAGDSEDRRIIITDLDNLTINCEIEYGELVRYTSYYNGVTPSLPSLDYQYSLSFSIEDGATKLNPDPEIGSFGNLDIQSYTATFISTDESAETSKYSVNVLGTDNNYHTVVFEIKISNDKLSSVESVECTYLSDLSKDDTGSNYFTGKYTTPNGTASVSIKFKNITYTKTILQKQTQSVSADEDDILTGLKLIGFYIEEKVEGETTEESTISGKEITVNSSDTKERRIFAHQYPVLEAGKKATISPLYYFCDWDDVTTFNSVKKESNGISLKQGRCTYYFDKNGICTGIKNLSARKFKKFFPLVSSIRQKRTESHAVKPSRLYLYSVSVVGDIPENEDSGDIIRDTTSLNIDNDSTDGCYMTIPIPLSYKLNALDTFATSALPAIMSKFDNPLTLDSGLLNSIADQAYNLGYQMLINSYNVRNGLSL